MAGLIIQSRKSVNTNSTLPFFFEVDLQAVKLQFTEEIMRLKRYGIVPELCRSYTSIGFH